MIITWLVLSIIWLISFLGIIMMTTKNSMAEITEAMQKGAADYIIKPFTKDIIIGKITTLLEGGI